LAPTAEIDSNVNINIKVGAAAGWMAIQAGGDDMVHVEITVQITYHG
jgi:hypothetical protein